MLKAVLLPHRGVIRVSGADARAFLDGLITNSMARVKPGQGIHAGLLTPQGKIIGDFFVTEAETGGFVLDVPLLAVNELLKRLTLYKLRAQVVIEDLSNDVGSIALWGERFEPDAYDLAFADPRLPEAGWRLIAPRDSAAAIMHEVGATEASLEEFHSWRIRHGLPEPQFDYPLGDTFPHEINMDQLHGIDFKKGCYVGQEVVSRMEHRGTARTRLIIMRGIEGLAAAGAADVLAGDIRIGQTGDGRDGRNLALVRMDRLADALVEGRTVSAGGVAMRPEKPAWWKIAWPFN